METLFEVGPLSRSAMGELAPVSWLDFWAYGQATKAVDEPWEYEVLMKMSRAYLAGFQHGKNHFAISPLDAVNDD
jgi:hypothetical protein